MDTLVLHTDHANAAGLAQALAKAINVRSEADFYENLLHCNDGYQRKDKLLSKGIADAEVERCLRQYSGGFEEMDPPEARATRSDKTRSLGSSPGRETGEPQEGPVPGGKQHGKASKNLEEQDGPGEHLLRLKDAHKVGYVIARPPAAAGGTGSAGRGWEPSGKGRHALTQTEKAKLEHAGRCVAERELKNMRYEVEDMPPDNPGFDLRATRDGEELRIEVKAHTGRATVVEVSQRQYKEYLGQQGYRWELWNVEHLAENDAESVAITPYDDIPDDALDVRTFRVDLKKCHSPAK